MPRSNPGLMQELQWQSGVLTTSWSTNGATRTKTYEQKWQRLLLVCPIGNYSPVTYGVLRSNAFITLTLVRTGGGGTTLRDLLAQ